MDRIIFTDAEGTAGVMIVDGVSIAGPMPPASAEYLPVYERLIAAGVTPEAYEPPGQLDLMPDISDRQFGEGLWRDELISYEDYLAFVGPGTVPPALATIIDTLADDDTGRPTPRKVARGLVTGAKAYEFANPLVDTIRQAQKWTDAQLRAHWLAWAAL